MKTVCRALALILAISVGARAEEGSRGSSSHSSENSGDRGHGGHAHGEVDTGFILFDMFLDLATLGAEIAALDDATQAPPPQPYLQRSLDEEYPPRNYRVDRHRPQAREGLLLSFGLGGGSLYASSESPSRVGAFDLDFRLGYGFSDRFQFFMDLGLDAGSYRNSLYGSDDIATWTLTFRGQTVLVGDRAGNGLNLNFGVGLGGLTRNAGYSDESSSPAGFALAGGLSYDARISPWFALSPEFFFTWHTIPNDIAGQHDVAQVYGMRLNFLWYLH